MINFSNFQVNSSVTIKSSIIQRYSHSNLQGLEGQIRLKSGEIDKCENSGLKYKESAFYSFKSLAYFVSFSLFSFT